MKNNGFWLYFIINSVFLLIDEAFIWIVVLIFRMTGPVTQLAFFFVIILILYCISFMPLIHIVFVIIVFIKQGKMDTKDFLKTSIIFTLNLLLNIFAAITGLSIPIAGMT